jgi:hypothetical protein
MVQCFGYPVEIISSIVIAIAALVSVLDQGAFCSPRSREALVYGVTYRSRITPRSLSMSWNRAPWDIMVAVKCRRHS